MENISRNIQDIAMSMTNRKQILVMIDRIHCDEEAMKRRSSFIFSWLKSYIFQPK